MKLENPTRDIVKRIMELLLIGVVVTLEEDKALNKKYRRKMPPEFDVSANIEKLDRGLDTKNVGSKWNSHRPAPSRLSSIIL